MSTGLWHAACIGRNDKQETARLSRKLKLSLWGNERRKGGSNVPEWWSKFSLVRDGSGDGRRHTAELADNRVLLHLPVTARKQMHFNRQPENGEKCDTYWLKPVNLTKRGSSGLG